MVRSRFKNRPYRRLPFKNREHILRDFKHITRSKEEIFKVYSFIGVGGSGKTRILDEISNLFEQNNEGLPIRITLESEASGTVVAPLKLIRDQAPFECLLFDAALAHYFVASGQIHALMVNPGVSSSIALKAIEAGSGAPGLVALPLGFAAEVYDKLKKQAVKLFMYSRHEFEEIDKLHYDSNGLLERLPHYLALDFERRIARTSKQFTFIYDSYEKQREKTLVNNAPWLREFIGTLDYGLHLIASREPLDWPDQDWGEICAPSYVIGELPIRDTRSLFSKECSPQSEMIDALTDLSKRIPFYIEILVNEYLRLETINGSVEISDLPKSTNDAVNRFVSHLEEPIQKLVIALANIQFFDRELIYSIIRSLNLKIDFVEIEFIFSYFFIEPVSIQANLYKTHDLLTDFVRNSISVSEIKRLSLEKMVESLLLRNPEVQKNHSLLSIYVGACAGCTVTDGDTSPLFGHLVEMGYRLYDAGYWRELVQVEKEIVFEETRTDGDLIMAFFSAVSVRRFVSVDAGLAALDILLQYRKRFGAQTLALDIEVAYLAELSGEYQWAREEIKRIHFACIPFDPNQRFHYRSLLYYADFLSMDGYLDSASDRLGSVYEEFDFQKHSDWAELVRHRGHAFRFSALYEEAELLYLRAIDAAQQSPVLLGKLQTNLAETRAWIAPKQAIQDAQEAIEQNTFLANKIEISKAHTAFAVAEAQLGNMKSAHHHTQLAMKLAKEINYQAGLLFATQADCIIAFIKGEMIASHLIEMREIVRKINTYSHIVVLTEKICGRQDPEEEGLTSIYWIESDNINDRLSDISMRLNRAKSPP